MKLIVCLDDKDGMLFNGRRQSMDSALRERMLTLVGSGILRMNPYSAGQFTEQTANMVVEDDFLENASAADYCFVEGTDIAPYAQQVDAVIIYRWNRTYPSDVKFPRSLFAGRWSLVQKLDFPGNSHEMLTEEIYCI